MEKKVWWSVHVRSVKSGKWRDTMYHECKEDVARKMFDEYGKMYPNRKFRLVRVELVKETEMT